MKVAEFVKDVKGKKVIFKVLVDDQTIVLDVNGVQGTAIVGKHPQHGWYYQSYSDEVLKVLGVKASNVAITHESAERAAEIIAQRKEEAKKEAERKREEEKQRIITGKQKIKVHFHDGEYLSGWEVVGVAADLLKELGLARYVSGWGMIVDSELVNRFGDEFTYQQAKEVADPQIKAKKEKEEAQKRILQAKFDEAKKTGKPVEINRWTEECSDPEEECDLDIVVEYAMPDGSVERLRHHTW